MAESESEAVVVARTVGGVALLLVGISLVIVIVRRLEDLERLAEWAATPSEDRPFLVLDVRITPDVIAPYQQEIIRVNS